MSHKFHVTVFPLPLSESLADTAPFYFVWVSQNASVTFFYCFQMDTPLYNFPLGHRWSNVIIILWRLPYIFSVHFSFIFSVKLFRSSLCNCYTRSLLHFSIVSKLLPHFLYSLIVDSFSKLCCLDCYTFWFTF